PALNAGLADIRTDGGDFELALARYAHLQIGRGAPEGMVGNDDPDARDPVAAVHIDPIDAFAEGAVDLHFLPIPTADLDAAGDVGDLDPAVRIRLHRAIEGLRIGMREPRRADAQKQPNRGAHLKSPCRNLRPHARR